jgi:hypothetical protein
MGLTKRDFSGVFETELTAKHARKSAALTDSLHLNHNGVSFISDCPITEWTELRVQFRLPPKASLITCRAVVVECTPRPGTDGYDISLLFLNLPKCAYSPLDIRSSNSTSIWISR